MTLKVNSRAVTGSISSKQARRQGKLPATIYGRGVEPTSVLLDDADLKQILRDQGRYAIVNFDIDGEREQRAMIQYISRNPITNDVLNVEFRTIEKGERVRVTVVINITGGDLIVDAQVTQAMQELSIEAPVDNIPTEINHDISGLTVGDVLTVADLSIPEGVVVLDEADDPVVSVAAPTVFEEPETDGDEDAADVETVAESEASGEEA